METLKQVDWLETMHFEEWIRVMATDLGLSTDLLRVRASTGTPKFVVYAKGGKTAGRASHTTAYYNLAFALPNKETYRATVQHELAHVIADRLVRGMCASWNAGHGTLWRWVFFKMTRKTDRCHSYERPTKLQVKHGRTVAKLWALIKDTSNDVPKHTVAT